jgi:hypothetical protein
LGANADTFTNKKTGDVRKGWLAGTTRIEGKDHYMVEAEGSKPAFLPVDEWDCVVDPNPPYRRVQRPNLFDFTPGSTVEFRNKTTGQVLRGRLVGIAPKSGQDHYLFKSEGGNALILPVSEWDCVKEVVPGERPAPPAKAPSEFEAKVREAMNKTISLDFKDVPLADVLTFLSALTGIRIDVDAEAIKGRPKTATIQCSDMRLEKAINDALRPLGLAWGLKGEAIFVSTPERINGKLDKHVQDAPNDAPPPAAVPKLGGMKKVQDQAGSVSFSIPADWLVQEKAGDITAVDPTGQASAEVIWAPKRPDLESVDQATDEMVALLRPKVPQFQLVRRQPVEVGGRRGVQVRATCAGEDGPLTADLIVVLGDRFQAALLIGSHRATFAQRQALFQEIIQSFRVR